MRPLVDPSHAEGDRQEEDRDEGQRAHRRLERPADREPPGASRHVVEHRDGHGPERDAGPEQEGEEIRAEELVGLEEAADGARYERDRADEERRPLEPEARVRLGKRAVQQWFSGDRPRFPPCPSCEGVLSGNRGLSPVSSLDLSPAGTSPGAARCDSWSARTYAAIAQRSAGGICCA